jgi:hypothetical protein
MNIPSGSLTHIFAHYKKYIEVGLFIGGMFFCFRRQG